MVVEGPADNTFSLVRKMVGATKVDDAEPGTIRGDFATITTENLVHACDGHESAAREIALWFPGGLRIDRPPGRCCVRYDPRGRPPAGGGRAPAPPRHGARTVRPRRAPRSTVRSAAADLDDGTGPRERRLARMSENVLSSIMGRDMAVDLGTANTVVYVRGRGIVLNEPSVVAVNVRDGRPLAVGVEAKRMIGRTPAHIQAIRPLKDGVIADFEICEKMLRYFIQKVHNRRWSKPRMVICVPSGITGVEQRAVQEAAEYAGARKPAYIIEEPMAAAIGAGLPVQEPTGNMIVDIGGGTTEVAVISLGGIVASQSVRVGGDELDESIVQFIKKEYSLAVGDRTAEEVKIALGSAWPLEEELHAEIRGRDLVTGLPKTIVTTTEEIREAMEEPVSAIVDAVKVTLDKTPPELAADIMEKGITSGRRRRAAHGLDARLHHETGMPIVIAPDPLHAVAIGSGQSLEEFEALKGVLFSSQNH